MINEKPLIALGGATGSGKTALALTLAQRYPQLVILSADSRQVYRQLNIGTGKVGVPRHDSSITGYPEPVWVSDGVSQFLIDIAEPGTSFSLTDYQREAYRLIEACWKAKRIPLLVGGTGLYLQAVIEGYVPEGAPDWALRERLATYSLASLQEEVEQLQATVPLTDIKNKRRLIRAIERAKQEVRGLVKRPIAELMHTFVLERPWEVQRELVPAMVAEYLDRGLVQEVRYLLEERACDKDWLKTMGLSYRLVVEMMDGVLTEEELPEKMVTAFRQLIRRQRTWFGRMPKAVINEVDQISKDMEALLKGLNA